MELEQQQQPDPDRQEGAAFARDVARQLFAGDLFGDASAAAAAGLDRARALELLRQDAAERRGGGGGGNGAAAAAAAAAPSVLFGRWAPRVDVFAKLVSVQRRDPHVLQDWVEWLRHGLAGAHCQSMLGLCPEDARELLEHRGPETDSPHDRIRLWLMVQGDLRDSQRRRDALGQWLELRYPREWMEEGLPAVQADALKDLRAAPGSKRERRTVDDDDGDATESAGARARVAPWGGEPME